MQAQIQIKFISETNSKQEKLLILPADELLVFECLHLEEHGELKSKWRWLRQFLGSTFSEICCECFHRVKILKLMKQALNDELWSDREQITFPGANKVIRQDETQPTIDQHNVDDICSRHRSRRAIFFIVSIFPSVCVCVCVSVRDRERERERWERWRWDGNCRIALAAPKEYPSAGGPSLPCPTPSFQTSTQASLVFSPRTVYPLWAEWHELFPWIFPSQLLLGERQGKRWLRHVDSPRFRPTGGCALSATKRKHTGKWWRPAPYCVHGHLAVQIHWWISPPKLDEYDVIL